MVDFAILRDLASARERYLCLLVCGGPLKDPCSLAVIEQVLGLPPIVQCFSAKYGDLARTIVSLSKKKVPLGVPNFSLQSIIHPECCSKQARPTDGQHPALYETLCIGEATHHTSMRGSRGFGPSVAVSSSVASLPRVSFREAACLRPHQFSSKGSHKGNFDTNHWGVRSFFSG